MFRLVAPAQYRRMPWKNGGGVTEEIATHPEGAAIDRFDWRVSIAEVARDGPFSRFAGIDRTIAVLEGGGMHLRGNDVDLVMRAPFEPYSFDGDAAIDCTLLAGPIRDFNAMVRRDRARMQVTVVRTSATLDAADFTIAFAAIGNHECRHDGDSPLRIAPWHTLIEAATEGRSPPLAIRPVDSGAVALVVRIECR